MWFRRQKVMVEIAFGDTVRVLASSATEAAGIAGRVGQVYGVTTPSHTDVSVLGSLSRDHAINVYFEDSGADYWLPEESVELLDHAPGTTITLDGIDKAWVRQADGSWAETRPERQMKAPWWRRWPGS